MASILQNASLMAWDVTLTLRNTFSSKREIGKVIPPGHPGAGGKWPEFIAAQEGDSRCSCPALNAMANHGILPRDGKNISFKELSRTLNETYNFAPTFCLFVPTYAANMLKKKYDSDSFNLADLDLHNGIEHDASLFRRDAHYEPDQSVIHVPYVRELLSSATGKDTDGSPLLTIADVSLISSKRRAESRAQNPDFSLSTLHKTFGSSNSSTLVTAFGGIVKDLEIFLLEERLPDGWEPKIRESMGLTILSFNRTVAKVEMGIDESKFSTSQASAEPVEESSQ